MRTLKIYLDNCCYNRPFDEQDQDLIRLETEAKLSIQLNIRKGRYNLVWSYILDAENDENPSEYKRNAITPWRFIAKEYCAADDDILERAREFMPLGIKHKDALHIACAAKYRCDYFITTDKKLLNKHIEGIKIINPVAFILETEETK